MTFKGCSMTIKRIITLKPHLSTVLFMGAVLALSYASYAQEPKKIPDGTEGIYHTIPEKDPVTGQSKGLQPNEADAPFSTFKIGAGLIYDVTAYSQSDVFKQQMDSLNLDLSPTGKLRDFRVLGSGRLKTKRTIT